MFILVFQVNVLSQARATHHTDSSEQGPRARNSVSALYNIVDWLFKKSADMPLLITVDVLCCSLSRYKVELGAKLLPREEFLAEFRSARDVVTALGRGPGPDAPLGVAGLPVHSLPRATAPSCLL